MRFRRYAGVTNVVVPANLSVQILPVRETREAVHVIATAGAGFLAFDNEAEAAGGYPVPLILDQNAPQGYISAYSTGGMTLTILEIYRKEY